MPADPLHAASRPSGGAPRRRWVLRALYWLAVTVVAIAFTLLLLQVIHSFDGATVGI